MVCPDGAIAQLYLAAGDTREAQGSLDFHGRIPYPPTSWRGPKTRTDSPF